MDNRAEFNKLLMASFVSQSGSHFLTLALSAFVLVSSGSPTQSGLIFVVSYLPSILVSAKLGHWIDQRIGKLLLIRNELISILSTVICGLLVAYKAPIILLCLVLGFRSLLMFVGRAASTKWIKIISPPDVQTARIKLYSLSFFLSTALAGVLLGLTIGQASIWKIVLIDVATYLLSAGFMFSLKTLPATAIIENTSEAGQQPRLTDTLKSILQMPLVRSSFLIVCFSQSVFQGAYSALVSVLPIQQFNIGISGVGSFQVAASIGITGGFLINWFLPKVFEEKRPNLPLRALVIGIGGVLSLLLAINTSALMISLLSFLALNFCYECVWLHHSAEFFRASPKLSAARYQFTLSACASFVMALSTLSYSFAIEHLGFLYGTVSILSVGVLIAIGTSFFANNLELRSAEVVAK